MKRISIALFGALAVLSLACNDTGDGGGGGPGGGFVFNSGYAFVRPDTRDVFIVDGSAPSVVEQLTTTGDNHEPSISPDGTTVIFVHGTSSGSGEIDVVPTTGGVAPSPLFVPTGGQSNLRSPVYSPDTSKIAFAFDRNGQSFVATIDRSGGSYLELTQTGTTSYGSPSWIDAHTLLLAAGNSPSNLTQLVTIDVNNPAAITNIATLSTGAVANRVVVSPDGSQAAFDARTGSANTPRIFSVVLATGAINPLSDHPDPSVSDTFPAWGTGGQVIFSSDSGGQDNVYAIASNTGTPGPGTLTVPTAVEPWFH